MDVSGASASVENAVSSVSNSDPISTKVLEKAIEIDKQAVETLVESVPDPSSSVGQNVDIKV